jgi:hypothetical protein
VNRVVGEARRGQIHPALPVDRVATRRNTTNPMVGSGCNTPETGVREKPLRWEQPRERTVRVGGNRVDEGMATCWEDLRTGRYDGGEYSNESQERQEGRMRVACGP